MGVVAARRAGLRVSAHQAYRTTSAYARSASPRLPGGERSYLATPIPRWAVGERKAFWARFRDDRDLIRFKVVLLTSLAVLTALLEWVG
jgi:hypothetical protein